MAKRLLDGTVKAALFGTLLWLAPTPALAQDKSTEAWQRISRLQSLVEHFFMETGVYPLDLSEMDQYYRNKARGAAPKPIPIPVDPATNQPFVYKVDSRKYSLSVPDASKYGGTRIAVSAMDWGYLKDLADLQRFTEFVRSQQNLLKVVATQVEYYSKDHAGQYPASLDDLLPKYFTKMPSDPLTGKNLLYKKLVDGYEISCPNPEKYGMKHFKYTSAKGIEMEQAPRGDAPKAPKALEDIKNSSTP
jgi:hypothetical protein